MNQPIKVNYQSTSSVLTANQWLRELDKKAIIACDFEVAIKYTSEDIEAFNSRLEEDISKLERIKLEAKLSATALDHPSHTQLTHLSVAWSESDSYVFILDNPKITTRILQWLVTTNVCQIWHNASYDFRQIQYRTGKFPILYEDTAIMAKTIVNHVDVFQAKVGLKELAGHQYGDWAISPDNFELSQMYDPSMLHYAATDACATFWLYYSIQRYIKEQQ